VPLLGFDAVTLTGRIGVPARDAASLHSQRQLSALATAAGVAIGLIKRAHIGITRWTLPWLQIERFHTFFAKSKPTVLISFMDGSLVWSNRHHQSVTLMPSGAVHPIFARSNSDDLSAVALEPRRKQSTSPLAAYGLLRFARNDDFACARATKQPDGQISKNLSSSSRKNIPLNPSGKSALWVARLTRYEGRCARHERAVGCGGRDGALDETRLLRTTKSCGPGAPVLAPSFVGHVPDEVTVARKPVTGESTK
jgi:hypothetical protein